GGAIAMAAVCRSLRSELTQASRASRLARSPPSPACGRAIANGATPSPQSKSAVADFDCFIEWPKPAYTRFRLGEGWGGGSGGSGTAVPPLTTPTPDPSPHGGGEKKRGSAGAAYRSPGVSPSALNTDPVGTAMPGWTMRIPSFGKVTGAESISP